MDFFVLGKQLLVALLLINAIFWGLFPHSAHCKFAANFGIKQCPAHWIHVYVMGLLSFVLALYVQQGSAGLH